MSVKCLLYDALESLYITSLHEAQGSEVYAVVHTLCLIEPWAQTGHAGDSQSIIHQSIKQSIKQSINQSLVWLCMTACSAVMWVQVGPHAARGGFWQGPWQQGTPACPQKQLCHARLILQLPNGVDGQQAGAIATSFTCVV